LLQDSEKNTLSTYFTLIHSGVKKLHSEHMPYPYNGVIAAQSNFQKGVINYHNFSQTKKKVTNGGTLYKNGL